MKNQDKNIAILWDIENVTPSSVNTLFIERMWEYAESLGRVVSANAYADWSRPGFKGLAPTLSGLHFYLVHVPRERKRKNSADMQLINDALELIRFYKNIDSFLLISGDSDFRPLLLSLRKAGKFTYIICDIKTAGEDLLVLADNFIDYRELQPGEDDELDTGEQNTVKTPVSYWFEALAETVSILQKEQKSVHLSAVKLRLKMLNPGFNEKSLGFKRWSDFVTAAVAQNYVTLKEEDGQTSIFAGKMYAQDPGSLQKSLQILLQSLRELDGQEKPRFHSFREIGTKLKENNLDIKAIGFAKLKTFIQSAETRGLVETEVKNLNHFAKKI